MSINYIGYVYITINLINNKIYIGQHKVKNNKHDDKYLGSGNLIKAAINKYGRINFKNEILKWCETQKELDDSEKYYISYYKNLNYDLYNITDGGNGITSEVASDIAIKRWKNTSKEYRQNHMKNALRAYKLKYKGRMEMPKCKECEGPVNSHKKTCSLYKKTYNECKECNAKHGHFKHCSLFVRIKRSEETRRKLSIVAKNRTAQHNKKISETLKQRWKNGDFEYMTCKLCLGRSNNHKKGCKLFKGCSECGSTSHLKSCSKFKAPKQFYCETCDKYITGKGNYKNHLNGKSHLNKLNK